MLHFLYLPSCALLRGTFCVIITVSQSKDSTVQYFVSLSYMFLHKKTVRVTLKTGLLFVLLKFVCCRTYLSVLETLNTAFLFFRWLCYCQVPVFCDSLKRHDPTAVFGRVLLRSVFSVMRRQLLEKFRAEKDKMPPDKRTIVLTHFPRYDVIAGSLYSWIETLI